MCIIYYIGSILDNQGVPAPSGEFWYALFDVDG